MTSTPAKLPWRVVSPAKPAQRDPNNRQVAQNRRARHDYDILDTYEAGMVLVGSEVKSLREGKVQLRDSFARVQDGEIWLYGLHVPPYVFASGFGATDPDRRRKLLLHKRQIDELGRRTSQEALTIVPLSMYFKDGRAKLDLALARGRKTYDKRHAIADRDAAMEVRRASASKRRSLEP
jgi:SsrA-binding protein